MTQKEALSLNSKGQIYYGLHFYSGVAEYAEPDKKPYRVYLNEDTLRKMDSSFAGRPVYVMHRDDVKADINELRKEADGWVIESFFNQADGKHWCKFIITSKEGERAVKNGMRLSNAYFPTSTTRGGTWNGVSYEKQILNGEYEHLALVPNPRYEESVIMTPEQFKKYNEDNQIELKKVANTKGDTMQLFKREKVENSDELISMHVALKNGREVTISQLVKEANEAEEAKAKPRLVNSSDLVEVDGEKLVVSDLVEELTTLRNAKKCNEEEEEKKKKENKDEDKKENEEMKEEEVFENEEDEDEKKKKAENKKKNAKLANAPEAFAAAQAAAEVKTILLPSDKVAIGKSRYGSGR